MTEKILTRAEKRDRTLALENIAGTSSDAIWAKLQVETVLHKFTEAFGTSYQGGPVTIAHSDLQHIERLLQYAIGILDGTSYKLIALETELDRRYHEGNFLKRIINYFRR